MRPGGVELPTSQPPNTNHRSPVLASPTGLACSGIGQKLEKAFAPALSASFACKTHGVRQGR
jgi:hypothetical protein